MLSITVFFILFVTHSCNKASLQNIREETRRDSEQFGPAPDYYQELKIEQSAPTADVEVRENNALVHSVPVKTLVRIQPTILTLDPDDLNKPDTCPHHPGIVKESYAIKRKMSNYQTVLPTQTIARNDCESMGIPYVFTQAGIYNITMTVYSDEGETAVATTALTVTDDATGPSYGFDISAIPLVVMVGQTVEMTSLGCPQTGAEVSWNFGDSNQAQGLNTAHTYQAAGTFLVAANCEISGFGTLSSSLTVAVAEEGKSTIPGYSGPPTQTPTCPGYQPASPCQCQQLSGNCQYSCTRRCTTRCSRWTSCF